MEEVKEGKRTEGEDSWAVRMVGFSQLVCTEYGVQSVYILEEGCLHRCWGIRGVWGPPWWWTGGEGGMRMRKWRGKIYILRILHIYKIDYILSSSFCQAPGNDVLHHCADPYDFIPRIGGNYNLIRVCSSPAGPSFSAQLGLTSWLPGKHKRKSSLNNC